MYDRNSRREGSEADPPDPGQWSADTGLVDSMWRLGLESTDSYPVRVGVPDCVYYMRTGLCGFGSRCRYNHPHDRMAAAVAASLTGRNYPERPREPLCQYYLRTGGCKFGSSCKFHHPQNAGGSMGGVSLNYHGYPQRPGEKECSHYLKTGQCKFGITCKFHHPQPGGISGPTNAPPFYLMADTPVALAEPMTGPSSSYGGARPPVVPSSYIPGAWSYGPMLYSPGVMPVPGWTSYSGPVSPALSPSAQPSGAPGSVSGVARLTSSSSTMGSGGPYPPIQSPSGHSSVSKKEAKYPERPGLPECQYFLRTGDCKYGSSCKFHHPSERAGSFAACYLSPLGLPLRPGTPSCAFYLKKGYCKFGPTCKFDHPMDAVEHNLSCSPFSEMPTAPYLSGSFLPGLQPSFSSSVLFPDQGLTSSWNDTRSSGGMSDTAGTLVLL